MTIDDQTGAPAAWQLNDPAALTARRQYVTAVVRQRLRQRGFRQRVLRSYQQCCAICRLRPAAKLVRYLWNLEVRGIIEQRKHRRTGALTQQFFSVSKRGSWWQQ